jgi:hypothetical protein
MTLFLIILDNSVSVIWDRATVHLPYCSGCMEKVLSQAAVRHLCLFLELVVEEHINTRTSFGFHSIFLSIKWNMRARGCVWDIQTCRRRNNSDARTQNRKYIQILHFRKDKNVLIHKCCFYSWYCHFNSFLYK